MKDLEVRKHVLIHRDISQPGAHHGTEDLECSTAQCSLIVTWKDSALSTHHVLQRSLWNGIKRHAGTSTCINKQ